MEGMPRTAVGFRALYQHRIVLEDTWAARNEKFKTGWWNMHSISQRNSHTTISTTRL